MDITKNLFNSLTHIQKEKSSPFSRRLSFSKGLSSTSVGLMDLSFGLSFVLSASCFALGFSSLIFSEVIPINLDRNNFLIIRNPKILNPFKGHLIPMVTLEILNGQNFLSV